MQLNMGYENSAPSVLVRQPTLPAPFIPRPMQQSPYQATQTITKAAQATKTSGRLPKVVAPVYRPPAPPKPAPKPAVQLNNTLFRSPVPAPVYKPIVQPSIIAKPPVLPTNPFATPVAPNVSAFQQIQNMANQAKPNNTQPVAKPFSLAGAKAVTPAKVDPNQITWTHGSVPDALANLVGSGLKKIASSLVPQLSTGGDSSANNPTLTAQNLTNANNTQNGALDALKYLLGGFEQIGSKSGNSVNTSGLKDFLLPNVSDVGKGILGGLYDAGKGVGDYFSHVGDDLKNSYKPATTPEQLKQQQLGAVGSGLNYAKNFLLPNVFNSGVSYNPKQTVGQAALDSANRPFGVNQLLPNPFSGFQNNGSFDANSILDPSGKSQTQADAVIKGLTSNASPFNQLQQLTGQGANTTNSGNSMADFHQMQDTNNTPNNAVPAGAGQNLPVQGGGTVSLNSVGMGSGGSNGSGDSSGGGLGMGMTSNADGSLSVGGSTFSPSDLMNLGLSADEVNALHQLAGAQAKQQNDVQRQALDTTQAQADATYNNDQQTVNNQLANNAQQLDNSSFQDYLKSRQAIADRGLASSGLSDAANTQLLLAKQQNMAQLQRQADQSLNEARTTHNNATTDVTGKKALLNDATTAGSIYQQLYQNALGAKQTNAKMALDLAMNQNNNSTKLGVAQLNNDTKRQIAQLDNQTKLTVNENDNATNLQKNMDALNMKQQVLNSQNWNDSQKQLISLANSQYDMAKQLRLALDKDPKNKDIQNQYQIAVASGNSYAAQATSAVNFNGISGGGGGSIKAPAGTGSYQSDLSKANSMGLDPSWNNAISWIVSHESGFNPSAQNKTSTAHGYAQFLNSTVANYDKKTGLSYNSSPVAQLVEMGQYLKDRYGTPQNAVNFWQNNRWY